MQQVLNKFLFVGLFLLCAISMYAQDPIDNAPYSRYGLGELVGNDFPATKAMGGISTAYRTRHNINLENPASLGYLNTTAFQVGVYSKYSNLQTDDASSEVWSGNLSHLIIGFPLKNPLNKVTETRKIPIDWGGAFGLLPFSQVGYDIETSSTLDNIGDVQYNYEGAGGQYQFFMATGASYKGFSAGLNWAYLFGQSSNQRTVNFLDITDPFSDVLTSQFNIKGSMWRLGLQYEHIFGGQEEKVTSTVSRGKQETRLTFGLTATPAANVTASTKDVALRNHPLYGLDTVSTSSGVGQDAKMPSSFGVGLILEKDMKWLIGVDFKTTNWDKYVNPAKPDVLANTWKFGIGGEYIPDFQSYKRYLKRVTYRAEFSVGTDERVVGGEQLQEYAVSFGMGLPIQIPKRGTMGYANLTVEAGQQGTPSLIRDNFIRISLGFSLNDNSWFYKQRYN